MRMREFLKKYRADIDTAIRRACPNIRRLNEEERRMWVLNDEGLYTWARSEGVRI